MAERDEIFRSRLIAVMTALNGGEGRDPAVRRIVGSYAYKLAKDAGAKNWADLKARASGPTYDEMLRIFAEQSARMQQAGDNKGVRGLEALALSLIARHQKQGDLVPGVGFLDRYIDECASLVKPAAKVVVTTPAPKRSRH
ncbi:MAG: hypothetical protein J0I48_21930 [Devosia sp.]|uniref:hypothetical protein n=1 Tax=Devosia sp. 66-22 TaxID=1895753 RepID=UPI00092C1432|nr:hypothetical protein [Devosia sp. 66-22]MBN9348826.1 hypothetical protein [Devosia sp.]OJX50607.1 MAG: hypothetical protein BGO81_20345 [Devosia sp. 66-22]